MKNRYKLKRVSVKLQEIKIPSFSVNESLHRPLSSLYWSGFPRPTKFLFQDQGYREPQSLTMFSGASLTKSSPSIRRVFTSDQRSRFGSRPSQGSSTTTSSPSLSSEGAAVGAALSSPTLRSPCFDGCVPGKETSGRSDTFLQLLLRGLVIASGSGLGFWYYSASSSSDRNRFLCSADYSKETTWPTEDDEFEYSIPQKKPKFLFGGNGSIILCLVSYNGIWVSINFKLFAVLSWSWLQFIRTLRVWQNACWKFLFFFWYCVFVHHLLIDITENLLSEFIVFNNHCRCIQEKNLL